MILGVSCFYHDSAAALVEDGEVIAAAEEERFTRQKHDNSYPENAIDYCLEEASVEPSELDKVVFYEKPILKFERLLTTSAEVFPHGYRLFSQAMPEWLGGKLRFKKKLRKHLGTGFETEFIEHHHSHAASTYHASPYEDAAVLTVDGVGEWKTNQMWMVENGELEPIKHIDFPDSIGLLYSTITAFLGFMVNNGEYKVMGLASYGEPSYEEEFRDIVNVDEDGSYELDQSFFGYRHSKKMWSSELEELLGEPRSDGEELSQRHKDIAATMQKLLEDVLMKQAEHLYELTDSQNLCMAGGIALNSAANGRIRNESSFDNIWIQPAAGDSGGAVGAALARSDNPETMNDVYLGPRFSDKEIKRELERHDLEFERKDREELVDYIPGKLADGKVIALFRGRMEWGPRALGNRSIIADPRSSEMRDKINSKVKFRESFRPFAPSVLKEEAHRYFDIEKGGRSPYMLFVHDVKEDKRDEIPAVTHVNGTSRIQTVERDTNAFYYDVIKRFEELTDIPVLLNTSFNLKGMPIVRSPEEAINCLEKSDIDLLVIGNYIVKQNES